MGLLDTLFGAAKVLIRTALSTVKDVVVETVRALEGTATGKVLIKAAESWATTKSKAYRSAASFAEEEAELGKKMARDGKLPPSDWDRKREIDEARMQLREKHAQADAGRLKEDLAGKDTRVVAAEADEFIGAIGLLTHKECGCGGTMAVTTSHRSTNGGAYQTEFTWACPVCRKRERFDPVKESAALVRTADPDLDIPERERHKLWNEPKTLAETNARLSSHLGEADKEVLCPNHLVPMKLFPSFAASRGLVLDSYTYACICTTIDGRRCMQKVPLDRMAQASAALRRLEGVGITTNRPAGHRSIYVGDGLPI